MVLEWVRRNSREFATKLKEYLFKGGDIAAHEESEC